MYTIAGRQIGSHYLAIATLGTMFVGSYVGLSGGEKQKKETRPPINAKSKDEEAFIHEFLESAQAEEKKAKH
ncbi:hypothetical protein MMC13_008127 [Lambiella insularis]|nr:hypothetical protein [Lambiella insularis]